MTTVHYLPSLTLSFCLASPAPSHPPFYHLCCHSFSSLVYIFCFLLSLPISRWSVPHAFPLSIFRPSVYLFHSPHLHSSLPFLGHLTVSVILSSNFVSLTPLFNLSYPSVCSALHFPSSHSFGLSTSHSVIHPDYLTFLCLAFSLFAF